MLFTTWCQGGGVMQDWLFEISLAVLYPAIAIVVVGATEFGNWIGRRSRGTEAVDADIGTLAGAALGLLGFCQNSCQTRRREVKVEFSLRRFENSKHAGGATQVKQATAASRDVLVVAGAGAEEVAELVVAS